LLFTAIGVFAILLSSCSNEGSVQSENTPTASQFAKPSANSGADTYVQSFYNTKDYTYGRSIVTKGEKGIDVTVDEVIVKNNARGYVISDASTGGFLYFIDIDRTNYTMKTYEVATKSSETIAAINNHLDYAPSKSFDLIKIADDVNNGNLTTYMTITLPKFWGSGHRETKPEAGIIPGSFPEKLGCYTYVIPTKTRFFITYDSGAGIPKEVPCP
jgi:hypothetical protein